jgi:predicted nucleic acid-binding protein
METVIETSIWVDYFRLKTPPLVRKEIHPWVQRADLALCEPILCELLRAASVAQRGIMRQHLTTIPVLPMPANLWTAATQLGQTCEDAGVRVGALDLLIATVCVHHDAELITFDKQFAAMAKVSKLRAKILTRAA